MISSRSRISAFPVLAITGMIGGRMPSVLADQATPEVTGYDSIQLTVQPDGVQGMPATLSAGRYAVHITSPTAAIEDGVGVLFAILPDGITPQQALQDVENADPFPDWFHDTYFGGGVNLQHGATEGWGVIDLTPGPWIVTSLGARSLGVEFRVIGEFPTDAPVTDVNVEIELDEMSITVTKGEISPNEQMIQVCNVGDQIHHLSFVRVPEGTTPQSVQQLWDSYMSGTPDANALSEADTTEVAYFAELSPGVCQSGPLTLKPGTYVLSCFVGDPEMGGLPHAFIGMWDLVVVT